MSSVISCTLNLEDNDLSGSFNLDRQREYQLTYTIKTDGVMGPLSLAIGAMASSPDPLPDIWDAYSVLGDSDLDAFCSSIVTKKIDPKLYKATCKFATLPRGRDPGEANPDPLARPVRYGGAKLVRTRSVTSDNSGAPLVTSAREEFDEGLEEDVAYAVLVARRNVATLDDWVADMATYINSVNSGTYRTLTARKWWCMDIGISELIVEQGGSYYEETWHLAMNLDTWDEGLLDRGWKVLEGDDPDTKQVNATDDNGKPLTAPVLLDGEGRKLAIDADPVELKFRIKREVSWASIPV